MYENKNMMELKARQQKEINEFHETTKKIYNADGSISYKKADVDKLHAMMTRHTVELIKGAQKENNTEV